jgi:hypothetical protein
MWALIAHGTRPDRVISPRGGRRAGRYLTVTVPPLYRDVGHLPVE